MVTLEYYNGKDWVFVGKYHSETIAWITLGGDNHGYRTVDENGKVLTEK